MGEEQSQPVKPQLTLWDTVSIIIGIVIGASVYKTPPVIFNNVSNPWTGMGAWALGGFLSLVGAFCYAELATTYPRSGGDYVYLTRAFGSWMGFLFGWAQLAVILTSSIGLMGFVFGDYAVQLWQSQSGEKFEPHDKEIMEFYFATAAIVALTVLNMVGVVLGKWTQNILTLAKIIGLSAIIVSGFFWSKPDAWSAESWDVSLPLRGPGFGVALILVLYAYGGWNDAAFVAADLRDRRNISRALILGTGAVTLIYAAVNLAYILGLGFDGVREFGRPVAADVLVGPLGRGGFAAMCILVMISALGAINGLTFAGSRVYATLGTDHSIFGLLGRWHPALKTPVYALIIQAVIAIAMVAAVGVKAGRDTIDRIAAAVSLPPLPWDEYFGGFDTLFAGTAPVFWTFFLLTGLALFILRFKDPDIDRPFVLQVPFYPVLPLIFCGMCLFGIYSAVTYAKYLSFIGLVPLTVGLPLFFVSRVRDTQASEVIQQQGDSP